MEKLLEEMKNKILCEAEQFKNEKTATIKQLEEEKNAVTSELNQAKSEISKIQAAFKKEHLQFYEELKAQEYNIKYMEQNFSRPRQEEGPNTFSINTYSEMQFEKSPLGCVQETKTYQMTGDVERKKPPLQQNICECCYQHQENLLSALTAQYEAQIEKITLAYQDQLDTVKHELNLLRKEEPHKERHGSKEHKRSKKTLPSQFSSQFVEVSKVNAMEIAQESLTQLQQFSNHFISMPAFTFCQSPETLIRTKIRNLREFSLSFVTLNKDDIISKKFQVDQRKFVTSSN